MAAKKEPEPCGGNTCSRRLVVPALDGAAAFILTEGSDFDAGRSGKQDIDADGQCPTKFTGRVLKAALSKYLAHRKNKKLQNSRDSPDGVKPYGRVSMEDLKKQYGDMKEIDLQDKGLRSFDRIAPRVPRSSMRSIKRQRASIRFSSRLPVRRV